MTEVIQLEGIDILRAVDLANSVRKVGDFEILNDLKPGIPSEAGSCVLAATFNCSCQVHGIPDSIHQILIGKDEQNRTDEQEWIIRALPWFVVFEEKKYAEALAKELDHAVYDLEYCSAELDSDWVNETGYAVALPDDVGHIAAQFDMLELPDEYYVEGYKPSNLDK